ncbi:MAG: hypothetical protein AAF737_04215 [Pseudomonadota bacterium]
MAYVAGHWFFAGFSIINKMSVAGCQTTTDFKAWGTCPFNYKQGNHILTTGGAVYHFAGSAYRMTTDGTTWTHGMTVVAPAFYTGAEWWGFRWNGVHTGPSLDMMMQANMLRPGARDWVLGYTY